MRGDPTREKVQQAEAFYDEGRFLDAYDCFVAFGEPETWFNGDARILASRVIGNLGGLRRAHRLSRVTWRTNPERRDAFYYYLLGFRDRHGAFETLRLIQEHPAPPALPSSAPETHEIFIWLLTAKLLADFRDFDAAETWIEKARAVAPHDPWLHVSIATVREAGDRYEEALASCEAALTLRPRYRPAIERYAHLLALRGREHEARLILEEYGKSFQSGTCAQQLASLYQESGDYKLAVEAWTRAQDCFRLAEKPLQQWLKARLADAHYQLRNYSQAVVVAEQLEGDYYRSFVRRLSDPTAVVTGKRIQLPVGFVRQHHMTCAPATLSAISTYWGRPIDHLALAAVITYDGTPDHEERHWMEKNGWCVREFRVTWGIAQALIDRGIPFTIVTTAVRSAHLQAVVGYDSLLETLIIRDPYHRQHGEYEAGALLAAQAPYGPRGMVLIPPDEQSRLEGLELPEAEPYDLWYRLQRALAENNREPALAAAESLWRLAPESRLAWWGRRALAYFDQAPLRSHDAVTALRRLFPDEPNLQLEELSLLQQLGRRSERLALLKHCARRRDAHPVFWREYTETLRADGREHERAQRYARRLLRIQSPDTPNLITFGHVLRDRLDFCAAAQVHRLAATLGDKSEEAWETAFLSSRLAGETDRVINLLRQRWARLKSLSAFPTITLCRCLSQLGQPEALTLLSQALTLREKDHDLHLFAADLLGRVGRFGEAKTHLETVVGIAPPARWLPVAALVASWQANYTEALRHWQSLLGLNPLHLGAQQEIARLLSLSSGREAALHWIQDYVRRFPHFLPLRQLQVQWLRNESLTAAIAELNQYLLLQPDDAWALREKALVLVANQETELALPCATLAEQIDPQAPASAGTVGHVLLALRRFDEARAATQRALIRSIDADWLFSQLLECSPAFADRRESVRFLLAQLTRQSSLGEGFLRFREIATGVLSPEELGQTLEDLRSGQPQHWQAWSACIQQSITAGRTAVALELATEATRRFTTLARLWVDLADVHRARQEHEAESRALTHALELAPGWSWASLRLVALLLRGLHREEAESVLRKALAHDPVDPRLLTEQAELLWHRSRAAEAIPLLERAIAANPSFDHAWTLLHEWVDDEGSEARSITLARTLIQQRAGDPEAHLRLARVLARKNDYEAALQAVSAALERNPLHVDAHDCRAWILTGLGRYDEALAACRPPALFKENPIRLRGRGAWIEWQRGNRANAVSLLKKIVEEAPDYSWAWQCLADWSEAMENLAEATRAATRFSELNPGSPYPLGYIADLKLKSGDRTGAADALRRALAIDPSYVFAAQTLLSLLAEQAQFGEAEKILALIQQHGGEWRTHLAKIVVSRWKKDPTEAERNLRQLCRVPPSDTICLTAGIQEFLSAFSRARLRSVLKDAVLDPKANEQVGALWVQHVVAFEPWKGLRKLDRREVSALVKVRAWACYLEWLSNGDHRLRLQWNLWREAKFLAQQDVTWSAVIYALVQIKSYRRATKWAAAWNTRTGLKPWVLHNLALSYYQQNRPGEAADVVKKALQLPADHTRATFLAWAAWDLADQENYFAAAALLDTFDPSSASSIAKATALLARALIAVGTARPQERRDVLAAQRPALKESRSDNSSAFKLASVRRNERQTLRKLHRLAGRTWLEQWYRLPAAHPVVGPALAVLGGIAAIFGVIIWIAASTESSGTISSPVSGIGIILTVVSLFVRRRK